MKSNLIVKALVVAMISLVAVSAAQAKGRKFGLFVGINAYQGGINPLKGCVSDATRMRDAMISKFGFRAADTTLLTDAAATRDAILANLQNLQTQAGVGDLVVFHYSGHGTLFPDQYSEEQDETQMIYMEAPDDKGVMQVMYPRGTYDSAIVPVDARSTTSGKPWRNLILDDELYAVLGAITRKGAQVVLISDSCHSGSIERAHLKDTLTITMQELATKEDVARAAALFGKSADLSFAGAQGRTQVLYKVFGAKSFDDLKFEKPATTRAASMPPAKGLYIALTGSRDDQFSLDVRLKDGTSTGLFTYAVLLALPKIIDARSPMSYDALMAKVKPAVEDISRQLGGSQSPQLRFEFGNPTMAVFSLPTTR